MAYRQRHVIYIASGPQPPPQPPPPPPPQSPALLDRMKEVVQRRQVLRQKGRGERKRKGGSVSFPSVLLLGLFLLARFALGNLDIFPVVPPCVRCLGVACRVLGYWIFGRWLLRCLCTSRSAWSDGGYTLMRQFAGHLEGFCGFLRPLVSGSYLSVLVSPEEYKCANLLVYSRIQLFLVRQWRHVHVILRRRGAFHGVSP